MIGVELGVGGGDAADVQVKVAVAEAATLCNRVLAVVGCRCAGWGLTRGGSRGDVGVGRLKVAASAPGVGGCACNGGGGALFGYPCRSRSRRP